MPYPEVISSNMIIRQLIQKREFWNDFANSKKDKISSSLNPFLDQESNSYRFEDFAILNSMKKPNIQHYFLENHHVVSLIILM